jgi:hypothetical protein
MRKYALPISLLAALVLVVSCASTPPQTPEPAQPEQAEPAAPAAPDAERARAQELQKTIEDYGLAADDPDGYEKAKGDLAAGEQAYGKDNAAAKLSYDAAIGGFSGIIEKGWPRLVSTAQGESDTARQAALDEKASIAVKDDYTSADAVYQRAVKEKDAGENEKAFNDFRAARDGFDSATAAARVKKAAALQSLEDARQEMSTSEQKADEATQTLADEGITMTGNAQE